MAEDIILKGAPQFKNLELVKTGVADVNFIDGNLSEDNFITHNLGYIPIALVYMVFEGSGGNTYQPLPALFTKTLGTAISFKSFADVFVDANMLNISTSRANGTGNLTLQVKYYLLRESAK